MRSLVLLVLLALPVAADVFNTGGPRTTNNDDTCDIAVMPAATLLLPYFEVDFSRATSETTIVTVTNTTSLPQVARVTLWTDFAYPVIAFNLFLTGYDVQSINLVDVIGGGRIAAGTATAGRLSETDNPLSDERSCADLPEQLPPVLIRRMQQVFTTGKAPAIGSIAACNTAGGVHENAVGYATIDVVGYCSAALPTEEAYFRDEIRYDNVLIGDYQQIKSEERAYGAPLVHIRAMPEGRLPAERSEVRFRTNLPQTFYGRYLRPGTPSDARQPLPSLFAARWTTDTQLNVWRESTTTATTVCSAYPNQGGALLFTEFVLFDEDENPEAIAPEPILSPFFGPGLPSTSRTRITSEGLYPPIATGATGGWLYMNLDRIATPGTPQNWVVVTTDRAVAFDAAALGNGCTPAAALTTAVGGTDPIRPAPSQGNRFTIGSPNSTANDDTCDIAVMPAATLLLPYFEVDLAPAPRTTTTFTVTNTTAVPQVARVTLWSDLAYPAATFNIFLTGYDVQRVDLHDVIASGLVDFGASTAGKLSATDNPLLDERSCANLPATLPSATRTRLQQAFTTGRVAPCDTAGGTHAGAVGYATIDVVGVCSSAMPVDSAYFHEIRFDNVLVGDYEHREADQARANPLVHIRAMPEGGLRELRDAPVNFPRTFYGRYVRNGADARQPLPSTFAARWIEGGPGFNTKFEIWREGRTTSTTACSAYPRALDVTEIVRFDEDENPETIAGPTFPASSQTDIATFPDNTTGAVGGWMYFNLDHAGAGASQNWIVVTMSAGGRYTTSFDAAALGNGCTPETARGRIGPAANFNP